MSEILATLKHHKNIIKTVTTSSNLAHSTLWFGKKVLRAPPLDSLKKRNCQDFLVSSCFRRTGGVGIELCGGDIDAKSLLILLFTSERQRSWYNYAAIREGLPIPVPHVDDLSPV